MSLHACLCVCVLSHVQLFVTAWTVAHQPSLSMGFSRQEYWSGLPFPPPGDLPDPGIKPASPALAGAFFTTEPPGRPSDDIKLPRMWNMTNTTSVPSMFIPMRKDLLKEI